ncbi:MAG TPA: DUF4258 domain-containing protein [Candidatus Wallbacteria bacterium]|nr:DUF4258 domain-containing protein [Candidatus Wallbacteria bacterium]
MFTNIQIEPHTIERANERGASFDEITDVLKNGADTPAKFGKKSKFKVYDFKALRNEKYYEQKRIEVIYLIENDNIITVTVYVFYGKWE